MCYLVFSFLVACSRSFTLVFSFGDFEIPIGLKMQFQIRSIPLLRQTFITAPLTEVEDDAIKRDFVGKLGKSELVV